MNITNCGYLIYNGTVVQIYKKFQDTTRHYTREKQRICERQKGADFVS